MHSGRNAMNGNRRRRCGRRLVHIVIIPDEDRRLTCSPCSESIDVRPLPNSSAYQCIERYRPTAGRLHTITRHETKHTEDIENRFVDSIACKRAESFEVIFVLELEGPAQHGEQVDGMAVLQLKERLEGSGGVGRIERSVAVVVRRVHLRGTSRAAFGVSFTDDNRKLAELGEAGNQSEALVNIG